MAASYSRWDSGLRSDVVEFKGGRNCDEGQPVLLLMISREKAGRKTFVDLVLYPADLVCNAVSSFYLCSRTNSERTGFEDGPQIVNPF
jgi:hypothetical protein